MIGSATAYSESYLDSDVLFNISMYSIKKHNRMKACLIKTLSIHVYVLELASPSNPPHFPPLLINEDSLN